MRIRENWSAMRSWRGLISAYDQIEDSQRLVSAGQRVTRAADDASALAISHKIRTQFQGLSRASRNALDGLSLVNTAEGALGKVHDLLHRARELAVQAANGIYTDKERRAIRTEVDHLLTEIDRIADTTQYNGKSLFSKNGFGSAIGATIRGLRSSWLEQAEAVISQYYGLFGDGIDLEIVFETSGARAAWISGADDGFGRLQDLKLHINLPQFGSVSGPDGGLGPVYNDRKVARALTQAILARNSNYVSLPEWLSSGAAEYVMGRNELLQQDLDTYGAAAIVNAIDTWSEDSLHHSSSYAAMKYLASLLGSPAALSNFMFELTYQNDLNDVLMNTLGIDYNTFINDFKANGVAFIGTLDLSGPDVGGINPGDASGVIPNGDNWQDNPLTNFQLRWPDLDSAPISFTFQVGANAGETLTVAIDQLSSYGLRLLNMNLLLRPGEAITLVDSALQQVSNMRANLGAMANRLEHTIQVNNLNSENFVGSYSRMVDLDYAMEMTSLSKSKILLLSSSAVMSHANTSREHVLWLLKDLSVPGAGGGRGPKAGQKTQSGTPRVSRNNPAQQANAN